MLGFLKENAERMCYNIRLPFYARKMDAEWSDEVWRGASNRNVSRLTLECGAALTVLPCLGYIMLGEELFATCPQSVKLMLPSERGPSSLDNGRATVTTIGQLLQNEHTGHTDFRLKRQGNHNEYILQHKRYPAHRVWLQRIRFIYDVSQGFARVQRFLACRAILRRINAHHFTKLAIFVQMVSCCSNQHWRAIQDTGILSQHIVRAYLGDV